MVFIKKFIPVFMLVLSSAAYAQDIWSPPETDLLLEILDHAYNLEFDDFDNKIQLYQQKHPERPEGIFAPVVAEWIKVTSDLYNPKFDGVFIEFVDDIIDKLEDFDDDDPLYPVAQFYYYSATGFKGIMNVTRENWFSAALDGRIAVKGVEDALEGKIPNPDAKFGTGLYLYYADILPSRYPILKPLFLFYPDGDKKRGLDDLKFATENGMFSKVIAAYMYSVILYTREDKFDEAFELMKSLSDKYPMNPTFITWQSWIATRINQLDTAEKLLRLYEERVNNKVPYYPEHKMRMVNYRLGRIYYKKEQYEKAISYLDKAISPLDGELEERTERYKVYSYLQKGYSLIELNKLDKAKDQFDIVLTYENYRNSHDLAEKQLKRITNLKNREK